MKTTQRYQDQEEQGAEADGWSAADEKRYQDETDRINRHNAIFDPKNAFTVSVFMTGADRWHVVGVHAATPNGYKSAQHDARQTAAHGCHAVKVGHVVGRSDVASAELQVERFNDWASDSDESCGAY